MPDVEKAPLVVVEDDHNLALVDVLSQPSAQSATEDTTTTTEQEQTTPSS